MSIFSSTQPSIRARLLPRFPANVVAGNGITITKSGLTYVFEVANQAEGTDGEIQFYNGGVLEGATGLTYNSNTQVTTAQALAVTGNATVGGIIEAGASIKTTPTTVALLPAVGTAGRRAFVTDANATTFASVVAGGGSNGVPVYDDGTDWRIG